MAVPCPLPTFTTDTAKNVHVIFLFKKCTEVSLVWTTRCKGTSWKSKHILNSNSFCCFPFMWVLHKCPLSPNYRWPVLLTCESDIQKLSFSTYIWHILKLFICMCMGGGVLPACVSDRLGLELQMVARCLVCAGIVPGFSWRVASTALNHWDSPAPQ